MSDVAQFGTGISATIAKVARVDGVGAGVGERSGPALSVTVTITNSSTVPLDLDYVVVDLYGPDGAPGSLLASDARTVLFSGSLAAGKSATGVYVLHLPEPAAPTAKLTVSYGAAAPAVVFEGPVPA